MDLNTKIPDYRRQEAYQALENAWKDTDVKIFMKRHEDLIDEEIKNRGRSEVMNFVSQRDNDPNYIPELQFYAGNIYTTQRPRDKNAYQYHKNKTRRFYRYDAITSAFSTVTNENYDRNEIGHLKAQGFIKEFLHQYEYGNGTKGMFLCGSRGVGKSYLMGLFSSILKNREIGFYFVNTGQLHKDFLNALTYKTNTYVKIENYQRVEVLILDDLGVEKPSNYAINEILFSILDYRMNHRLPTFFTSNYNPFDYKQHLIQSGLPKVDAERLLERIETLAVTVEMTGPNRRNKN